MYDQIDVWSDMCCGNGITTVFKLKIWQTLLFSFKRNVALLFLNNTLLCFSCRYERNNVYFGPNFRNRNLSSISVILYFPYAWIQQTIFLKSWDSVVRITMKKNLVIVQSKSRHIWYYDNPKTLDRHSKNNIK